MHLVSTVAPDQCSSSTAETILARTLQAPEHVWNRPDDPQTTWFLHSWGNEWIVIVIVWEASMTALGAVGLM